MNKIKLMDYICNSIEELIDSINDEVRVENPEFNLDQEPPSVDDLERELFELASRREHRVKLPPYGLSTDSQEAICQLRAYYNDDVTKISLVLSYFFPREFIFYRVSKSESEILAGLDFFSEVYSDLAFPFNAIGGSGFDRYLELNDRLIRFARRTWPNIEYPGFRISLFLYRHLASLFCDHDNFQRYWIISTNQEYWDNRYNFDQDNVIEWSGRKNMSPGDLVFMYGTAPISAITDVYEVDKLPMLDSGGPWDGYWVDLKHLFSLPEYVSFNDLAKDPLMSQWSVIRGQFQGVIVEPMPHACFNWLIKKVPSELLAKWRIAPEPEADLGSAGEFATEQHFEDEIISPLLKSWGLNFSRQVIVKVQLGRQRQIGYIDYLVKDSRGDVTIIENKVRIVNSEQLEAAACQAKSYALFLGLSCFVVGAPEGLWLFSLSRGAHRLEMNLGARFDKSDEERFRGLLLKLSK